MYTCANCTVVACAAETKENVYMRKLHDPCVQGSGA